MPMVSGTHSVRLVALGAIVVLFASGCAGNSPMGGRSTAQATQHQSSVPRQSRQAEGDRLPLYELPLMPEIGVVRRDAGAIEFVWGRFRGRLQNNDVTFADQPTAGAIAAVVHTDTHWVFQLVSGHVYASSSFLGPLTSLGAVPLQYRPEPHARLVPNELVGNGRLVATTRPEAGTLWSTDGTTNVAPMQLPENSALWAGFVNRMQGLALLVGNVPFHTNDGGVHWRRVGLGPAALTMAAIRDDGWDLLVENRWLRVTADGSFAPHQARGAIAPPPSDLVDDHVRVQIERALYRRWPLLLFANSEVVSVSNGVASAIDPSSGSVFDLDLRTGRVLSEIPGSQSLGSDCWLRRWGTQWLKVCETEGGLLISRANDDSSVPTLRVVPGSGGAQTFALGIDDAALDAAGRWIATTRPCSSQPVSLSEDAAMRTSMRICVARALDDPNPIERVIPSLPMSAIQRRIQIVGTRLLLVADANRRVLDAPFGATLAMFDLPDVRPVSIEVPQAIADLRDARLLADGTFVLWGCAAPASARCQVGIGPNERSLRWHVVPPGVDQLDFASQRHGVAFDRATSRVWITTNGCEAWTQVRSLRASDVTAREHEVSRALRWPFPFCVQDFCLIGRTGLVDFRASPEAVSEQQFAVGPDFRVHVPGTQQLAIEAPARFRLQCTESPTRTPPTSSPSSPTGARANRTRFTDDSGRRWAFSIQESRFSGDDLVALVPESQGPPSPLGMVVVRSQLIPDWPFALLDAEEPLLAMPLRQWSDRWLVYSARDLDSLPTVRRFDLRSLPQVCNPTATVPTTRAFYLGMADEFSINDAWTRADLHWEFLLLGEQRCVSQVRIEPLSQSSNGPAPSVASGTVDATPDGTLTGTLLEGTTRRQLRCSITTAPDLR